MAAPSRLPNSFHVTSKIDFTKPVDKTQFQGRNVIVTGGASGIGLGIVDAFAEAGYFSLISSSSEKHTDSHPRAYVTILDINDVTGHQIVSHLTTKGYHVHFYKTDVTSWEDQVSGFKAALAFHPSGTLDIVIASAGLPNNRVTQYLASQPTTVDKDPEPPKMSVIDVNVKGYMYSSHLALHYFRATVPKTQDEDSKRLSKQLIFLCSTLGYTSTTDAADYTAAKYAVRGLWKSLRYMPHALSPNPASPDPTAPLFRTNLIAPTMISTPMTKHAEAMIRKIMPVGEIADVVEAVMRVAGDESASGRAMGVPAGKEKPGDGNFDLEDDWNGLEGGALAQVVNGGALKGLEFFCGEI